MRQINIKELKNKLSKELLNLPVEITKHGKVVATIIKGAVNITPEVATIIKGAVNITPEVATIIKGAVNITPEVATIPKKGVHHIEAIKEKLTEIIKKKQGNDNSEATSLTEETPTLGYPKSYQARKKKKQ